MIYGKHIAARSSSSFHIYGRLFKIFLSATFTLIFIQISTAQPVNDEPCGAIPLPVDTVCNFTFTNSYGATNTGGLGVIDCGSTFKDVWFTITVPASGMFEIVTATGTINNATVGVYTGVCTDLNYESCDESDYAGDMPGLQLQGYIPGSTAYIRFYRNAGGTGTFYICVFDNHPPLVENNDCVTAQHICTQVPFEANSPGDGDVDDLTAENAGCLDGETQSSFYYFTFEHPGEFSFKITPLNGDDDYNFAVWGPDPVCPLPDDPIRCSSAVTDSATGIETTYFDLYEDSIGDGWLKHIEVNAGETYLLMIDNASGSGEGFELEFLGPSLIGCIDYFLPVTLTSFTGFNEGSLNILDWTTATEINNDYFSIERSYDGEHFISIGEVGGAGTTTIENNYKFIDDSPLPGNSYYRLKQVDYNGDFSYSNVVLISYFNTSTFSVTPNPSSGVIYILHQERVGGNYSIEIANATASKQYTTESTASNEMMQDVVQIPDSGIYWVIIRNENGTVASEVVVK